jgi:hypothetical protein
MQHFRHFALDFNRLQGYFTFPRPVTLPCVFLTLCAGGKYTSKFRRRPGMGSVAGRGRSQS